MIFAICLTVYCWVQIDLRMPFAEVDHHSIFLDISFIFFIVCLLLCQQVFEDGMRAWKERFAGKIVVAGKFLLI